MKHLFPTFIAPGSVTAFSLAITLVAGSAGAAEPLTGAGWLAAQHGNPHVAVLDIRPAADYLAGHIPGAVSAGFQATGWVAAVPGGAAGALPPMDRIAATIGALGVGDADEAIIVGGDFAGAARVYWTFKVLGHTDVSILDGGWKAWTGPVETGPSARQPAVFTPHYNAALRAELPEVAASVADGRTTFVDARPLAQWSGAVLSPIAHAAGHLPGAVSVDESAVLTADGHLKSRDALALLFAPAGEGPAIVYCNSGYLSAADWFVLSEVLRRHGTKLYEGSMSEWTADASRPVVR